MSFTRLILSLTVLLLIAAGSIAAADDLTRPKQKGYVTIEPVPLVTLVAGKPVKVEIRFRVTPGYHINSNKPNSELLIPTTLQFASAEKIKVGNVSYPAGEQFGLAFSPTEKLSVYSGDVTFAAPITAAKGAAPGTHTLTAELHYQACNDNSCFPPKTVPVDVVVNVKGAGK